MGARTKYAEIRIRRKTYPSVAAAAAALKVSTGLIYKAILTDRLDAVGRNKKRGGHRPMQIAIRGQTFANARAAAAHFGVTAQAIYQALSQGDVDRVSRGWPPDYQQVNSRPITICGRTWPSHAALSRALGRSPSYAHVALTRGRKRALIEQVMAHLMREEAAGWAQPGAHDRGETTSEQSDAGQPAREGTEWTTRRAA